MCRGALSLRMCQESRNNRQISNGQCVDVNETPKFNFCDSYNEPYVHSLFVFFHDAVILIVLGTSVHSLPIQTCH